MANYRGSENVEFIWNGTQSDPQLRYDGMTFNYWDIEDALWGDFCEYCECNSGITHQIIESNMNTYEDAFNKYVQENVENYLNDVIAGGYFD